MSAKADTTYFPERIYAPTLPTRGVSLGIDRNGRFVNLTIPKDTVCIGVTGKTGAGKSVIVQAIVEQLCRSGAEVLYGALKGVQREIHKGTPNVVYAATTAAGITAAIAHVARIVDQRIHRKDTGRHLVALVIDQVDMFGTDPMFENLDLWKQVCRDVDFIISSGGQVGVVAVLSGQRLDNLPTTRRVERDKVFSSLIVAGRPITGTELPGTFADSLADLEDSPPIGRAFYCTDRGVTEFQAFMPNPDWSLTPHITQVRPNLVTRLVADDGE